MKKLFFLLTFIFTANYILAQNNNQLQLLNDFYTSKGAKIIAKFAHPMHKLKIDLTQVEIYGKNISLSISFKGKLLDFKTNYILTIDNNGLPISIIAKNEGCVNPSFNTLETIKKSTVEYLKNKEVEKNKELYIDKPLESLTCIDMCLIELWTVWIKKYQYDYLNNN
jgi:hypothetical protein